MANTKYFKRLLNILFAWQLSTFLLNYAIFNVCIVLQNVWAGHGQVAKVSDFEF